MKDDRFTIRINKNTKQRFMKYAKSKGVTPSSLLVQIINSVVTK